MNRIKLFLSSAAILFIAAIFFAACNDRGDLMGPDRMNFDSPQFAIVDYSDVINGIEDATVDSPMMFNTSLFNYSFMGNMSAMTPGNPMMRGNLWMEHFDFGKHLGFVFRNLKLTDDQKSQLKDLMAKFHDSMKPLVQQFRDANADIIAKANDERKAIMDQVKAGTLSRTDAQTQLKALNDKTRLQIEANPKSVQLKSQMCDARNNLISTIEKMLTPEQLVKWNDWKAKAPDPCK